MHSDVFIALYTNQCKSYCDTAFFDNLLNSNIEGTKIALVDNSSGDEYLNDLHKRYGDRIDCYHVVIPKQKNNQIQFLQNVKGSLDVLRKIFLEGDWKYFITLETDVLPVEHDWISLFKEVTDQADMIGGLYYFGFHDVELWLGEPRLEKPATGKSILSGCTLYKREIIEQFPFRWSELNLGAFPDAWICYDVWQHNENAGNEQYKMRNYTKIKCKHLEKSPGNRGHNDL